MRLLCTILNMCPSPPAPLIRADDNGRPPLRGKKRVSFACEPTTINPKTTTTSTNPPQPETDTAQHKSAASTHRRRMSIASRKRYMR